MRFPTTYPLSQSRRRSTVFLQSLLSHSTNRRSTTSSFDTSVHTLQTSANSSMADILGRLSAHEPKLYN